MNIAAIDLALEDGARFGPARARPADGDNQAAVLSAGPKQVLAFLLSALAAKRRAALVAMTGVIGRSAHEIGALMGICEDGRSVGSFSGGCLEAAVVAEAIDVMTEKRARLVRFGEGSPYFDVRLSCGGGVDLLFQPLDETLALAEGLGILDERRPLRLALGRNGGVRIDRGVAIRSQWIGDAFIAVHKPALRLAIFGHGAECEALTRLCGAFGADVALVTPNADLLQWARSRGVAATALRRPIVPATLAIDPWTAVVMLFHDHDWEPPLLEQLLKAPAFFVGAMGSRAAHEKRIAALRALNCSWRARARLVAPLGVIASARDPATLALSALAQIADRYRGLSA